MFIRGVELMLKDIKGINSKGYLNELSPIPHVESIIETFEPCYRDEDWPSSEPVDVDGNRLCYYLLMLNLYTLCSSILNKLEVGDLVLNGDLEADLRSLLTELELRLPNSIKINLRRQGIKIIQNIYGGFDTEYELDSSYNKTNNLLSVQLACNVGLFIKLPSSQIKLFYVNPQTSELATKFGLRKELQALESSIINGIYDYRNLFLSEHDKFITDLKTHLSSMKIPFTETMDSIIYSFDLSDVRSMIKHLNIYSFEELVSDSSNMVKDLINDNALFIINLINGVSGRINELDSIKIKIEEAFLKRTSRITYGYGSGKKLSITTIRNLYICCHLTTADLSILSDFESLKDRLDIVNKCFCTRGLPMHEKHWSSNIYIRDTVLLSPGGKKSLAALGEIYGKDFEKIDIGKYRGGKMRDLMVKDKDLFDKYAIQDALITLKHVNEMTKFYFKLGKVGVPITLSSISIKFVEDWWKSIGYNGYQIRPDYSLGNLGNIITPKGLTTVGSVGLYLSHYVASYKGGRNESFMYGVDTKSKWYDYDLVSAYTTGMAYLGHPRYDLVESITLDQLQNLCEEEILINYIVLECRFTFPEDVKFPCLPCSVDEITTIYPRQGVSVITGVEYLAALSMGCVFENGIGVKIPFAKVEFKGEVTITPRPFTDLIKSLQSMRREHPKGSFLNLMYKEIGNSIYGQVSKGLSRKKAFDIKLKGMVEMQGGVLSNPVLACYITSFIRSVIGECLNNISKLGGQIVSVTTDGFITDIEDLESKLLMLPEESTTFLRMYKDLVKDLSDGSIKDCLELKNTDNEGIISWTTRGQYGIGSLIKATTGFQSQQIERRRLVDEFTKTISSPDKSFSFIQQSLRQANEIYKKGGHVIMNYADRNYKLTFDNKRQIVFDDENNANVDPGKCLLNSKPWECVENCGDVRGLLSIVNTKDYSKILSKPGSQSYKRYIEVGVRSFIKGYLCEPPLYGLKKSDFDCYQDIIDFVKGYEPAQCVKLSRQSISNLRNRRMIVKNVPRIKDIELFVDYVKTKINHFDPDLFFK